MEASRTPSLATLIHHTATFNVDLPVAKRQRQLFSGRCFPSRLSQPIHERRFPAREFD